MTGDDWDIEQPWVWSLDTMIGGPQDDGVWRGKVADVAIEGAVLDGVPTGTNPPELVGDRVVVGPTWWDNHTVDERRSALLAVIGVLG